MSRNFIWITGAKGRLGSALVPLIAKKPYDEVIATDKEVDVTDIEAVEEAMEEYRPTTVINCASLSDRNYCDENMVEAFRVNALGARNLASATRKADAKLIHMSTDSVFDGKSSGQMTEFDMPDPLSIYGKSKLAGENYVRELNPKHLVIRSSWVYGMSTGDYFSYVVEHGKTNTPFDAPLDRISTPTSANELARFVACLMDEAEYGIYHASCEGMCSRHEFARAILGLMGYDRNLARETFLEKYGWQTSTLLQNLMMKLTGIYSMPQWKDALKDYVEQVKGNETI